MVSGSSTSSGIDPKPDAPINSVWQKIGRWDPVFDLANVAIHTHVLPSGKVLYWGRRDKPGDSMNEHVCTPHVWDPSTGTDTPTPQPVLADGRTVNLFCSGHTFLPDGKLLVAGGHLNDGNGVNQACVYDHANNTWTALPTMNGGRWYPTATTLADGRVLVSSGSGVRNGSGKPVVNDTPQIWDGAQWHDTGTFIALPLFPRMHVAPDGRVFMAGSNAATFLLDTAGAGTWAPLPGPGGSRPNGERQYAPSVMYEPHKVIYIGGGNDAGTGLPSAATDLIDFSTVPPAWKPGPSMTFRRRQHNATILPDGTVLVTGGTSGPGFNDVSAGKPVHVAELWNPATGAWTSMATEAIDRCYHGTAVLLPDATVLSAGGGEFMIAGPAPNPPIDTHRDAQIFHPPYLFQGPRPQISAVPSEILYGEPFAIGVTGPEIGQVTMLRLPSVTHAFDQNQRINIVNFTAQGTTLTANAPAGPAECPPGHYMLFVLSTVGVPSVARIIHIATATPGPSAAPTTRAVATPQASGGDTHTRALDKTVRTQSTGTRVTVGLTAKCPYGLGPCWGGAYEALTSLDGVAAVSPIPNTNDSTADVYLIDQTLPDLDQWQDQIAQLANGSYDFRGVEVTLTGTITEREDALTIADPTIPALVRLLPLRAGEELLWDLDTQRVRPASKNERATYRRLLRRRHQLGADLHVRVTGPLRKTDNQWSLLVRTAHIQRQHLR